jgi:aspartate/methionine/tyrosine aminotransferase
MLIHRFFMEDWLADNKDSCAYNLGESGVPDITVRELLARCGETPDSLGDIVLKDHDTRGTERLRTAIADNYGPAVHTNNITAVTGTGEALFILFNLLLEDRKTAVVPFPSFQALYEVPRAVGATVRFYRLSMSNGFVPEPDEVCGLIDDSTGVVVINTPHNPSGVLIPPAHADAIIRKAEHHGATVLFDEHYRFLPMDSPAPLQSFADPSRKVIATGSITKCFGVIGLRMGWIAAPEPFIDRICDFRDYLTHTLSPVSDYLACRAIEERDRFLPPIIATIRENRTSLSRFMADNSRWSWTVPEAGVVSFPSYGSGISSDEFARELIRRQSVFVLPGSAFETEGHVRMNLGQDTVRFSEALTRIGEYCNELEKTR